MDIKQTWLKVKTTICSWAKPFSFSISAITLFYCLLLPGLVQGQSGLLSSTKSITAKPTPSNQINFTEAEKAWLSQGHVVRARVGVTPPLHFGQDDPKGMSVDYLNLVAERAGFDVEYVSGMPWNEALQNLRDKKHIDLTLTAQVTPERKKFLFFTKTYIQAPTVIFNRVDSSFVGDIEDLYGKTVAVERGYLIQKQLSARYPQINLHIVKSSLDALKALAAGDADAYLGSLLVGTYLIQTHGLINLKVAAPAPFKDAEQSMAIRNDWPELVSIIDKTLATFKPENHAAINDRWLPPIRFEYGITSWDIFLWVAGISSILLTIISIIFFWNKKLVNEIEERQKVEKELIKNQQLLNQMSRINKVGGWALDLETETLQWTDEVYRIHELSMDYTPTVENAITFYSEKSKPLISSAVELAIEKGKPFDLELELTTAKGNSIIVNSMGMRDFKAHRIYGTFQDITERKKAEEKLAQLIIQLQDKNAEQERFVYTISHDLKAPLVTISGFCGVAKEDFASGKQERGEIALDYISQAANRMQQLINELLEISRVGFNVKPKEKINLGELVGNALISTKGIVEANNTKIEVDENFPDVAVDKKYLLQVLENLITNACRYSHSAVGGSHVKIGFIKKEEGTIFYIKDNGIGIESQHLEKVFGLFERLDSSSDSTGVGLAIVKRIIENHGGRIWAESEGLGHGTTFFFTLPEGLSS